LTPRHGSQPGGPIDDGRLARLVAELEHAIEQARAIQGQLLERAMIVEERAGAERRRYQDLFELAPDAYLVTDHVGKILEANQAFGHLVGRAPRYIRGKPLAVWVEASERNGFRQRLLRLGRGQAGDEWELRLLSGGDGLVSVAARAIPEAGPDGEVIIRWLLRDVTERKRAEEAVRALNAELEARIESRTHEVEQASAQLAAVLRELPEGVVIVGPDGEVQLANTRAQELLEGVPDALAAEAVKRALRGEGTAHARAEVERGGERLLIEYASTPVRDARGEVVAAVLTFQDIAERELRERAQRDFVTNAAHELQTPLAAIASAVEVLKAGAKHEAKTRDRFLDHIDNAVQRLDRLTRALLVLARAQSRDELPRREMIPLRPLLESVASALRPATVPVLVACPAEIAVIANRPLLEQALVNLGGNALKHSRGRVVLSARRQKSLVLIEVADSGPGIPPSERKRVFDRFYRGGEREGDGFGLGLAIVRDAVVALSGELELESSTDGTRVSIRLPGARVRRT
jgi:PAS domain S-box-containing protein